MKSDETFMQMAMDQALSAAARDEVPIGAVMVNPDTGAVISAAGNRTIQDNDPSAHAEILAIRHACKSLGNYRLTGLDLYVTLEPCAMCAGAISLARIRRLVMGTSDPKGGAVDHGPRFFEQPTCHHRPEIVRGMMAEQSGALLREFFAAKR